MAAEEKRQAEEKANSGKNVEEPQSDPKAIENETRLDMPKEDSKPSEEPEMSEKDDLEEVEGVVGQDLEDLLENGYKKDLVAKCEELGLDSSGNKPELIERIRDFMEN